MEGGGGQGGRLVRGLVSILAVAALYFVAARLALLMAVSPGYATAVWPAAGLALGAVLVLGRGVAVGVAVGSFLANAPLTHAATLGSGRAFAVAGVIGLGAALQAIVGAALVSRACSQPLRLERARDIWRFLLLGGPAGCIVAASVGVGTLYVVGGVSAEDLAFNWITWWVGDVIGVVTFAPVFLALANPTDPVWRRRRVPLAAPLLVGFSLITLLFLRVVGDGDAYLVLALGLLFIGMVGAGTLVVTGRLERRTAAVRARLAALVESSSDAILAIAPDGRILDANPAARALYGYGREIIGLPVTALAPPEAAGELEDNIARALARESIPVHESLRLRKDGVCLEVSVAMAPITMPGGRVTGISSIVRPIGASKQLERELRAALAEREVLLREVHHRVKNNLQIVSSILSLEAARLPENGVRAAFHDSQARVRAIALVHEQLYGAATLARVALQPYVRALVAGLARTDAHDVITANVEVGDLTLPVDRAIPCGLIINELVTNAAKHAHAPGAQGHIGVRVAFDGARVELSVSDDGVGLAADAVPAPGSLGLTLVHTLASQLGAELRSAGPPGATFSLSFAPEPT